MQYNNDGDDYNYDDDVADDYDDNYNDKTIQRNNYLYFLFGLSFSF